MANRERDEAMIVLAKLSADDIQTIGKFADLDTVGMWKVELINKILVILSR